MASSHRICQEMGIQIVAKRHFKAGPLEPRQTRSRAAIKEIAETGAEIGYPEMVYDVLGLFLTSEVNSRHLYGECIRGVGHWLRHSPLRTADIPFIRPAFAEINMAHVYQTVQCHRMPVRPVQIGILIAVQMADALEAIDINRKRTTA